MNTETATDNIYAARILLNILRRVGLWQTKKLSPHANWLRRWTPALLLHSFITLNFAMLMWVAMFKSSTMEEAGEVMYMVLTETALLVKVVNIWHLREQAQDYISEIDGNAAYALRSPLERNEWMREQRRFRLSALFYILLSLSVCICSCLGVLISSEYELPFIIWLPFDWRCPTAYWYAYAYDSICILFTCISNTTSDMIYCYFLFHLSMLYKLIAIRFGALHDRPPDAIHEELRDIFRLHRRIRLLTARCEALISAPILGQIVLSALVLCFSGYRLQNMVGSQNVGEFLSMGQYLTAMTLQIFMPCYYANEINLKSDKLTTAVYMTDWFTYALPTRKLIIIYMEFLKRPARIRAGNFFEVGLPIFTKTMNNAYSFFAVLLNMSQKD